MGQTYSSHRCDAAGRMTLAAENQVVDSIGLAALELGAIRTTICWN